MNSYKNCMEGNLRVFWIGFCPEEHVPVGFLFGWCCPIGQRCSRDVGLGLALRGNAAQVKNLGPKQKARADASCVYF